jgi:hypothetical protein
MNARIQQGFSNELMNTWTLNLTPKEAQRAEIESKIA